MFVKYNFQPNLRQRIREERGDTYDPICVLDMESDNKWIAKKENLAY